MNDKMNDIIEYLLYAERDVHEVFNITYEYPNLTIEEAYEIQEGLLERRLIENKTKRIGLKLGLLRANRRTRSQSDVIYGFLHEDMLAFEWKSIDRNELIHPRIEPEIAFFIDKDLDFKNITEEDILKASKFIAPALEVIDSRYKDFKFTKVDAIADNCSASRFVVGSKLTIPNAVDLSNIGMVLSKNGKVEQTGSSARILGNPLKLMALAANQLASSGKNIQKGDIVLSGAISEAITLNSGDTVLAEFDYLGSVSIYCS